jgi:hypothetical protein
MGLYLVKDNSDGSQTSYYNIQRMDIYPTEKVMDISVNGFISKELRDAGKTPNWQWSGRADISPEKVDILRSEVYDLIKSLPEFEGAQDA